MVLIFPKKVLLLLTCVTVILASCAPGASPVSISITHPVRQNLTSWISSNGKVEPVEPFVIQSQLTTFVEKVLVKQGDIVRHGQILMTLDAQDLESELARVKGEL